MKQVLKFFKTLILSIISFSIDLMLNVKFTLGKKHHEKDREEVSDDTIGSGVQQTPRDESQQSGE